MKNEYKNDIINDNLLNLIIGEALFQLYKILQIEELVNTEMAASVGFCSSRDSP